MKTPAIILAILCIGGSAMAGIHTETVKYKEGETDLAGYLAYDDAQTGKRPGVIVVHEWWGLTDHPKKRAEKLAELGYVAFALDMYGTATDDAAEAGKLAGAFRSDADLSLRRFNAALDVLKKNPHVDPEKIAAIGFCFGGTCVLNMARMGVDLDGVVSFHGGLKPNPVAEPGVVKAKVLVLHGADDSYVPAEEIAAFQKEMNDAGVDWQMIYYSGAVHSFTNPEADKRNSPSVKYHKSADERSWRAMVDFFKELFG